MLKSLKPAEIAGLAALCALGLWLRVMGAQGSLWIDEIWSLHMVRGVDGPADVFLRLVHDNNHPFNSLYLYFVRGSDDPVVLRGFSIALGVLCIPAAFWAARPFGAKAPWFLAAMATVAIPFVHYGSEARGYAGLILCSVLAIGLVLRSLEGEGRLAIRWWLGGVMALGMGFHLTMVFTVVALGIGTLLYHVRQVGSTLPRALELTYRLFLPAFGVTVLWFGVLAVAVSFSPSGGVEVGGVHPFVLSNVGNGLGGVLRLSLGLPDIVSGFAVLLFVLALIILAARWQSRTGAWCLAAAGLVILPAALFAARLPNLDFPRYFLFSALLVLFWAAAGLERLDFRRPAVKAGVAAMAAFLMLGHGHMLNELFERGRGGADEIVARILEVEAGEVRYGTAAAARMSVTVDHFSDANGVLPGTLRAAATTDCPSPRWQIVELERRQQPSAVLRSVTACAAVYELELYRARADMSGIAMALYRLRNAPVPISVSAPDGQLSGR